MDINTAAATATARPGKSGQSVGHLAKAAVAEARANGTDLPKNAQGVAASAIAGGADPASVFAAKVVTEPPEPDDTGESIADAPVDAGEAVPDAPASDAPPAEESLTQQALSGYGDAGAVVGDQSLTEMETALTLLQG